MSEELIYKVGVEGTQSLDNLERVVTDTGTATSKTMSYMSQMRAELKDLRGEMLKNEQGTEKYNRALLRASDIQGKINDANDKIKMGIKDLGQTTKNVTSAITGFAGGFQVLQASMQLFGVENEDAIKSIMKLQQTMAVVQGLAVFAQGINDLQNMFTSFGAEAKGAGKAMDGFLGKAGKAMAEAGDSAALLGANLAGTATIADKVNDGNVKITKSISGLKDGYGGLDDTMAKFNITRLEWDLALVKEGESVETLTYKTRELITAKIDGEIVTEDVVKVIEDEISALKASGDATKDVTKVTEAGTEATDKAGVGVKSFTKSILTSIATMVVFLAVIAAISWAFTKLIEALNKIPEDVKIKIDLEDSALNKLVGNLEKARLFALAYNKARREGDKDAIDSLEKINKKEAKLSKDRLDMIAKNVNAWRKAFAEYLEIAKNTYYNEALAKKQSEMEVAMLIEIEKQKMTKAAWNSAKVAGSPTEIYALGRAYNKATKELSKLVKEAAILAQIKYKDVPYQLPDETGAGAGSTTISKAQALRNKKTEQVEKDLLQSHYMFRITTAKKYTEEELVMMKEFHRKYDVLQDDSLIKYTEYQIKIADARDKDLSNEKAVAAERLANMEWAYERRLKYWNDERFQRVNQANEELKQLQTLNDEKFRIEEEYDRLVEARGVKGANLKAVDAEIAKNVKLAESNDRSIESTQKAIEAYKERIKQIDEMLSTLDGAPDEIAKLKEELDSLNFQIIENSAFMVKAMADNTQAILEQASAYAEQMGNLFGSMDSMTKDFMQAEDNKTNHLKNNLQRSKKYREADIQSQQKMIYDLEMANYEAKKRTFERNKAFQIGEVSIGMAKNQIDIMAAWLDPKTGGPLNPANIAIAAAASIANLAAGIGAIAQIRSTTLDQPIPPGQGDGANAASGGANIALSPNKTALTSKEENLNMLFKSGQKEDGIMFVKVSDINKVQNKVGVREHNSNY